MKVIIRTMNEADIPAAIELWIKSFNRGFSEHFDTESIIQKYLERNNGLSSVAYINDKLVGALMCGHDGRRGSIYHTAVYPEYRGQRIGRQLEKHSLSKLRQEGINTGFLFINERNPGSKEFWKSIGWNVIEDIKYLYKEF